ncbi:MAG: hypothetical protein U0324_01775 [Polyangiales bacterium]
MLTRPALVALALALSLPAAAQRRHRRPTRDAGAPVTPPPPRDPEAECRAVCGRAREQCCARGGNGPCPIGCADVGHFCEMDCDRRFRGPRPSVRPVP